MPYLVNARLEPMDRLDQYDNLAHEVAGWLRLQALDADDARDAALKMISAFAYWAVTDGMTDAETMAGRLEASARYCREYLK
jgi:hypothetical protein